MAGVQFSSDANKAITRKVSGSKGEKKDESEITDIYEVGRCAKWIHDHKFQRVALQFPDELLADSVMVTQVLQAITQANVFILGDTSYGSCCVDEVAAQHYSADSVIHFGRTCLSPTNRLPVLFIFGKSPIETGDCCEKFAQVFLDNLSKVIIMYDVTYQHALGTISDHLRKRFPNVICSQLEQKDGNTSDNSMATVKSQNPAKGDNSSHICRCRRIVDIQANYQLSDYSIFYIGEEGLTLTNLMMNYNKSAFYTYNPMIKEARKETLNINKALMKRYYMIERAKDARIVGIVVGTLGVSDYLSSIDRLKELIKKAGKKSYTFVVGKLNIPKLANFMEVDVFVLVACPENTLIDSSEFYKPVVTPFEMEIACNRAREWTGDYYTDFRELLPGAAGYVELQDQLNDGDHTDVSLVTGKLRSHGFQEKTDSDVTSSAVISRNEALTVAMNSDTAASFLSEREWQGLERRLGETPVTKAVEGQTGIAAGYTSEQQMGS